MIKKEELIIRIENSLTTRMVKELFKSIVDQCNDIPIPKKELIDDTGDYVTINEAWKQGWNACIDEIEKDK